MKSFFQLSYKTQAGFTLIELIVVTGIIGVFAGAIALLLNPSQQVLKGNDARRKADLKAIQQALESYYHDAGRYPVSSGNRIQTTSVINWGNSWQPYMNVLPKDPSGGQTYVYYATPDGQTYALYASLERGGSDPDACANGDPCVTMSNTFGIAENACGGTCNYGVTSSNISP